MMGSFVFHGVGQGLFYSGSIEGITKEQRSAFHFVYDCGGISGQNYLHKEISTIPQVIDFIAISHLHDDHINGLPILIKGRKIKRIFLPYFAADTYKDVFIAYLIAHSVFPQQVMFHVLLYWYTSEKKQAENSASQVLSPEDFELYYMLREIEVTFVDAGETPISSPGAQWNFLFFNKRITATQLGVLQKQLKGCPLECYMRQGNPGKLKQAYHDLFKNLNLTSLLLLHYQPQGKKTLLTGDVQFDSNLEARLSRYISVKDAIIFQIPHHGAKQAWNIISSNMRNTIGTAVLSFGLGNIYRHPSRDCIDDLNNQSICYKLVTQARNYHYTV